MKLNKSLIVVLIMLFTCSLMMAACSCDAKSSSRSSRTTKTYTKKKVARTPLPKINKTSVVTGVATGAVLAGMQYTPDKDITDANKTTTLKKKEGFIDVEDDGDINLLSQEIYEPEDYENQREYGSYEDRTGHQQVERPGDTDSSIMVISLVLFVTFLLLAIIFIALRRKNYIRG